MSDLIHTVQSMYDAFGRGDIPFIFSRLDSNVLWEFEAPPSLSFGGIRRGPGEAVGFFEGIGKDHADPRLTITDLFSDGASKVAAFGRYDATVITTGKRVSTPLAHFWTFQDGKVIRYVNYINTAAFVEAAA